MNNKRTLNLYIGATIFLIIIFSALLSGRFSDKGFPEGTFSLVTGISALISGLWTYKNSDDFYTDHNGERQYIYFEHKFMFLDMKTWAYIFWTIGGFASIGGLLEIIQTLSK